MPSWFGRDLAPLPSEFEIVNLQPRERPRFLVRRVELGYRTIHVGRPKRELEHVALGVELERIDKPGQIHKWALTSSNAIAVLEPQLADARRAALPIAVEVHARFGKKHYEITIGG